MGKDTEEYLRDKGITVEHIDVANGCLHGIDAENEYLVNIANKGIEVQRLPGRSLMIKIPL